LYSKLRRDPAGPEGKLEARTIGAGGLLTMDAGGRCWAEATSKNKI
tara:strand:- start:391 stop:528 length:138 start_codon:yes stop_codon:yes gene_type:complete